MNKAKLKLAIPVILGSLLLSIFTYTVNNKEAVLRKLADILPYYGYEHIEPSHLPYNPTRNDITVKKLSKSNIINNNTYRACTGRRISTSVKS